MEIVWYTIQQNFTQGGNVMTSQWMLTKSQHWCQLLCGSWWSLMAQPTLCTSTNKPFIMYPYYSLAWNFMYSGKHLHCNVNLVLWSFISKVNHDLANSETPKIPQKSQHYQGSQDFQLNSFVSKINHCIFLAYLACTVSSLCSWRSAALASAQSVTDSTKVKEQLTDTHAAHFTFERHSQK